MLPERLHHVTIRNYRSLEDVSVDLGDLTILVGQNGSGKSNFLEALQFLSEALRRGLDAAFVDQPRGELRNVRRVSTSRWLPDVEISVYVELHEEVGAYELTLASREDDGGYFIKREQCRIGNHIAFEVENGTFAGSTLPVTLKQSLAVSNRNLTLPLVGNLPEIKPLYAFLTQMRFYSILPNQLRLSRRILPPYPLDERGENLASALNDLVKNNKRIKDLYESLAHIVPDIDVDEPINVFPFGGQLIVQLKHRDGSHVGLEAESDGSLRVLALLAALYQTPSLPLFGIEEPDLMIHPGAMGILSDIIFEASHHSQIILTTHSPDLISRFKADTLRIVELVDGSTKIGPLREDQRQIIEDQLFGGGDLLRLGGLARE